MRKCNPDDIVISGVGITASNGQGQSSFSHGLLSGNQAFSVLKRPGRQLPDSGEKNGPHSPFIGAEIDNLVSLDFVPPSTLRTASFSSQAALVTIAEAWEDARLKGYDPYRIGLVVGGSNFQQRELVNMQQQFAQQEAFVRPTYGMLFMDSDLCGLCTETFGIQGLAHTLGGASASGQVAIINAINSVLSGQIDICIAMGALMDLSYWELQALRSIGALGSPRYSEEPTLAARPFDKDRDGFIFGESCGVVVIERYKTARDRGIEPYAHVSGWAAVMDGNRNPNPSFEGEVKAIQNALAGAGMSASQIDYINPHGTGSTLGDETELEALRHCNLTHAYINTTKSLIGHGLSAAGTVEVVTTLIQMQENRLHPSRNISNPIDLDFNWVLEESIEHSINNALTLSMGFGGVNTALCFQRI